AQYYLTQKIKPVSPQKTKEYAVYIAKLAAHHAVMRAAMKTKQTVSPKAVAALSKAVDQIAVYWSNKKK
ncbi:MAG: superoxide dismutase [Ni], partial [Myxococcota bacterium]